MSKHTVLITGGGGLVGQRLTEHLQARGHRVIWLTHSDTLGRGIFPQGGIYRWDTEQKKVDERPLAMADTIVHLAGADICATWWSPSRKREIIRSRVITARMLSDRLKKMEHHVKTFISASAIGFYGNHTSMEILHEESPRGEGFLAEVCRLWENEAHRFEERLGIRTVILRSGLVLSSAGGFFPKAEIPARMGLIIPLGNGRQFVNWIHVDDLCGMFVHAIERQDVSGTFNAVSPSPLTNDQFSYALTYAMGGNHLRVAMPEKMVKFVFGEISSTLLNGTRVSSEKIQNTGFEFVYTSLNQALRELLR